MRVAVVTGAARGIGAATVRRLAGSGWGVVALDRCADDESVPYPLATHAELEALAGAWPRTVLPLVGDVRQPGSCEEAVRLAGEHFGGLDVAVACAGVIRGGEPFWDAPPAELEVLLAVNLLGVANLARVAVPAMLGRPVPRSGRFIAIASAAAHTGLPRLTAYGATKHAVLGLVRGLADDLSGTGVSAVAVSPGSTRTEMLEATASLYQLESVDGFAAHQSVGRIIEPDEVAAAIAWLASEESSGMTGSAMHVDGGFTG
jgi:SDR family mycofactocin-dependent oxidoreductase